MTKVAITVCTFMVLITLDMVLYKRNPAMQALVKIVGWWPFILVEVAMVCYIAMMLTIMLG